MNQDLLVELSECVRNQASDRVFILSDSNVALIEEDLIRGLSEMFDASLIITPAGEENKNLRSLESILMRLTESGATRKSILICVGGGMTTDIGGFAAAIFKRGICHINVATTLLAAVDAAVGGKTGIDFLGFKNEIGAFRLPAAVFADSRSFGTLPPEEILSGFGEVIKTALIASEEETLRCLAISPLEATEGELDRICRFCSGEKMRIVEADPTEKGLRKVLNFGHTAGHAIESLLLEKGRPLPHGSAIAHGNLVALILSHSILGMDKEWVSRYTSWLRENYPPACFTCSDYARLSLIASHDKKNSTHGLISFTLLRKPGEPVFDCEVTVPQFLSALDIYQELMGR